MSGLEPDALTEQQRQTILMVEDSLDDVEATLRAFKKSNLVNPVHHAASGQAAIDYIGANAATTGLILLDLNMPGLSGVQTLERLKSEPQWCTIPVIVLTTSNDMRDVNACYERGANSYVCKPVDLAGLFDAIERLKEFWIEITILPRQWE